MDKLAQELLPFDNVEWDRQPDGFASLSRAQLMVSDISGVIFDFAFVFLRPVISVGAGPLKDGFEAWEIPHEAWEVSALDTLGRRILPGDEKNVVEAVQALLADDSRAREKFSPCAKKTLSISVRPACRLRVLWSPKSNASRINRRAKRRQ